MFSHNTITILTGLYCQYVKESKLVFKTGDVINLEDCMKITDKVAAIKALQEREYLISTEDSIKVRSTALVDTRLIHWLIPLDYSTGLIHWIIPLDDSTGLLLSMRSFLT